MNTMNTIKDLSIPTQRAMYFPASPQFEVAMAVAATRNCMTLSECAGLLPRLISDAYLMGGEL
jgi:hypothetical protein